MLPIETLPSLSCLGSIGTVLYPTLPYPTILLFHNAAQHSSCYIRFPQGS